MAARDAHPRGREWARRSLPAIAVALAVGIAAGLWLGRHTGDAGRQPGGVAEERAAAAIRRVLDERLRCEDRFWQAIDERFKAGVGVEEAGHLSEAEYVDALAAVDLTACPADFQEAFVRYRQAEADHHRLAGRYHGAAGKIGGVLEYLTTGTNPADHFQTARTLADERAIAVEVAALRYGVQARVAGK